MLKKIIIVGMLGLLLGFFMTGCEREEPRPVETPTAPPPAPADPDPAEPPPPMEPADPEEEPATEEPATEEPATETPATEEPAPETPEAADIPEEMTFEARNGNVPFPHQAHAGMFECSACHEQDPPGEIPGWGRDVAHALCIECHKAEGAGPVGCADCHIRN